jgi:hypothetical protein
MSDWYTAPQTPALRSALSSEQIKQALVDIEAAFDLLPIPAGGGEPGFDGGRWDNGVFYSPQLLSAYLGTNTNPSFGSHSYIVLTRDVRTELAVDNRGFVRNTNGDLWVLDNTTILFMWDEEMNTVVGSGTTELATTATARLLYIPTMNGTASNPPSQIYTGSVPIYYDRAANRIGAYNGAWRFTASLT